MKKIKGFAQFIKEDQEFDSSNGYKDRMDGTFHPNIYNEMIDYTLLEESATDEEIIELCRKADMMGVKSVCVLPKHVKLAVDQLKESDVLVCTVIDFPGGNSSVGSKISETRQVVSDGADEVDMVLNYNKLKSGDNHEELVEEVSSLVDICHTEYNKDGEQIILKVIVESGSLSEEETEEVTQICLEAGADFIKTSTGKTSIGAELNKVKIMADVIKKSDLGPQSDTHDYMRIKASGGIRTLDQIKQFEPYVDRFGMGFGSVDKINGIDSDVKSNY